MKLKIKNILLISGLLVGLILSSSLMAQDKPPAKDELTDEEKAKANNPLASAKALNVQYYYRPHLNEVEGGMANTNWYRLAIPTWKILWRVSAPLETRHVNNSSENYSKSGFGDIDIFAAYLAVMKPKFTFGIGPSAAFNTASDAALGTGRNSLGLAAVVFAVPNPKFQTGALIIWRGDIGGDDSREKVNLLALQPFFIWQLGQGLYFRSVPVIPIDLNTGDYHIPLGMGIGKVIKINKTVFNFFIEPQPSILVKGLGQPVFQIYAALNMQF